MGAGPLSLAFVYPQLKRLTGAQRLILQLASTLVSEGHAVTLVSHRIAPVCRAALAPTVTVIETGQRVDWTGRHLVDSALEYALSPWLVGRLPAAVDATMFFGPPSLPALAVARRRRPEPLLSFCYEPPRFAYADRRLIAGRLGPLAPLGRLAFGLYRPLDRWLIGQAHLICANGRFGAAEIAATYRRPALVIDHGVALIEPTAEAQRTLSQRFDLGDDSTTPIMLTVNHLHPRKRIDLFLATLAEVRRRWPATIGVVAGEGVDRDRLARVAAELGVSAAVRWTGFVPEAELAALYRRATVYLHTGQRETFGLSVLEAAVTGCPVVAVDEGGPRDILGHGRLGQLVPAERAALAAAVAAVLADPAAAQARGRRAAMELRQRFRWEHGAQALVAAVRRLQAGHTDRAIIAELDHASADG